MSVIYLRKSSETIRLAKSLQLTNNPLRYYDGSSIVAIPLVDIGDAKESGARIRTLSETKGLVEYGYYSLWSLIKSYGNGTNTPHSKITNGQVVATDTDIIYSTSSGNWLPTSAISNSQRLSVYGINQAGTGKTPVNSTSCTYRIWYDSKVRIQSKTWGNHARVVGLNRTDTFQRGSSTTSILVNGVAVSIAIGSYKEYSRITWNPGDHGSGITYMRVYNKDPEYFEVVIYVYEVDEESDSDWTKIDSYIELV